MERKNPRGRINTTLIDKRISDQKENTEECVPIAEWKDKEKRKVQKKTGNRKGSC